MNYQKELQTETNVKETEFSSISNRLQFTIDELQSNLEAIGSRLNEIHPIPESKIDSSVSTDLEGYVARLNGQINRLQRLVNDANTFRLHLNNLV